MYVHLTFGNDLALGNNRVIWQQSCHLATTIPKCIASMQIKNKMADQQQDEIPF